MTATALQQTVIGAKDSELRGHEFHFSTMEPTVENFPWAYSLVGGRKPQTYEGGYAKDNVLASYLHINFAGSTAAAKQLVDSCATWREQHG